MEEYIDHRQEPDRKERRTVFELTLNPNLDGFRDRQIGFDDDHAYIPPEEEVY